MNAVLGLARRGHQRAGGALSAPVIPEPGVERINITSEGPPPFRIAVGDDDVLLREGVALLLIQGGFAVVAQAGDAEDFLPKALAHKPDVAVDIHMPPGRGDDGLLAALELLPGTGVLLLSKFYEERYALDLIDESPEGGGYLLKERVGDVEAFTDAVARVAAGGSALDPEVVGRMLGKRRRRGPLDTPVRDFLEGLPAPQRRVLEIAFGVRNGGAPDRFLVGLAVLTLLAEAAGERPFVCVVDDAQWLDRASAQVLAFVARRLLAEPVALIFAARETGEELRGLPELEVRGLPDEDAGALLRSVVRFRLDDQVRDRVSVEARANPLALLKFSRRLETGS